MALWVGWDISEQVNMTGEVWPMDVIDTIDIMQLHKILLMFVWPERTYWYYDKLHIYQQYCKLAKCLTAECIPFEWYIWE